MEIIGSSQMVGSMQSAKHNAKVSRHVRAYVIDRHLKTILSHAPKVEEAHTLTLVDFPVA